MSRSLFTSILLVSIPASAATATAIRAFAVPRPTGPAHLSPAPRAEQAELLLRQPLATPADETTLLESADLARLNRRVEDLTLQVQRLREELTSPRRRVDGTSVDNPGPLRDFVLATLAEERETRRIQDTDRAREEIRERRELEIRTGLAAGEFDLEEWQIERLVEIMIEENTRREAIMQNLAPGATLAENLEAALAEHRTWLRDQLTLDFGSAFVTTFFGE